MSQKLAIRQRIEQRAYQIYVERGHQRGNEMDDWLAAEEELTKEHDQTEASGSLSSNQRQNSGSIPTILDFYGLREQPFGVTPDPAYLYHSRTHGEALASVSRGIKDDMGFLALIAEPGMGKTTLLYQLMEELLDSARIAFLFQTRCNSRELFEYILRDLGIDTHGMGLVAMHNRLNELLFEEMLAGKRFVLVIDEAQTLDESVLETVRMLSNFETHHTKLLQIVLAGQPRLAEKLAQPRLSQLRQRIAVLSHLERLTATETACYIDHRLKVAGYCGEPLFVPEALSLIALQSQGIPRNINNICYNSLLVAHARGQRTITFEILQQAVACLDIESLVPKPLATAGVLTSPMATPLPSNITGPNSQAIDGPVVGGDRQTTAQLTYKPLPQFGVPRWLFRTLILTGILFLLGSLLPSILGRPERAQATAVASSVIPPVTRTYNAEPQNVGTAQLLTVVAQPGQTLEQISLLYVGHFDARLYQEICTLNPELKDPNHIESGQLIRLPLPPRTLRKGKEW